MTREEVLHALGTYLRAEFGKLLVTRAARRTRRVTGGTWSVSVVVPAPSGDVPIAELEIDEDGTIVNPLELDHVLAAIRKVPVEARPAAAASDAVPDAALDFGMGLDDEPAPVSTSATETDPETLYARAQQLLAAGDGPSLHKARVLMPRLLSDADKRGAVLVWMAVIERKLDQIPLALGYLEAACREFADRFDVDALEKAGAVARAMMPPGTFDGSPIQRTLEQCRERMKPIDALFDCPQFFAASPDERDWLGDHVQLRRLERGETLVREGEPSRAIFVIKSGLVGVHLEKAEGGTRLVRCCFPGWLLGESSVLVADDPRCTATLRAEQPTEVWVIDAAVMREVMGENEALQHRIAATKQLHRIDSFFSMHDTIGQLEVQVRDEMLQCIEKVQTFDREVELIVPDAPVKIAGLVARGEVAVWGGPRTGEPAAVLGEDRFFGVRDALHAIPAGSTVVARPGATVTFFNAELLRQLGARSPEHVIAILERLG